jgi:hypothetical protein
VENPVDNSGKTVIPGIPPPKYYFILKKINLLYRKSQAQGTGGQDGDQEEILRRQRKRIFLALPEKRITFSHLQI